MQPAPKNSQKPSRASRTLLEAVASEKMVNWWWQVTIADSYRSEQCLNFASISHVDIDQVFDINSRAILRTLDSHKQPVHVTKFSSLSPTHILSCSDDTTVKIWDVPSQTAITTFTDHTDYVRSGQISSSNPHLILTGSYDSTVRLFDTRSALCEMVMSAGQGSSSSEKSPVEQVAMSSSGTVALSTAGPILRVWDLVAGGRCTRALSNHQKTVTALAYNASGNRLLTGSLDQMVKVYDVSTYKVVHTMRYPAPVLCLAVSVKTIRFHSVTIRADCLISQMTRIF